MRGQTRQVGRAGTESVMFEALESRVLLSGNVTAYTAAGNLYIIGDIQGNDIVITDPTPGMLMLSSGGDATTINGAAGPEDFAVTGDVWAFPGLGDDLLTLDGCALPRDLWYFGSLGNNELNFYNVSSVRDLWAFNSVGDDTVRVYNGSSVTRNAYIDQSIGENLVQTDNSSVGGNLTVYSPFGDNAVLMNTTNVGGSLLVMHGYGPSQMVVQALTIAGNVTVLNTGGGVLGGGFTGYATLVQFYTVTVNGNLTVLNSLGDDMVDLTSSTHVFGTTYVSNGLDASQFRTVNGIFDGPILLFGGNGGDLPDHAGYSSWVDFDNSAVGNSAGDTVSIFNGLGSDNFIASSTTFQGAVSIFDSLGGALFDATGATFSGNVSLSALNATGNLPGSLSDFASVVDCNVSTAFNAGAAFTFGAGDDDVALANVTSSGSFSVNSGPGGTRFVVSGGSYQNVALTRGDGGALAPLPGLAGSMEFFNTTVSGNLAFNSGAGSERFVGSGLAVGGAADVSVGTGAFSMDITTASSVAGTLTVNAAFSDPVQSSLGSAGGAATSFGALAITTGAGADVFSLRNISVGSQVSFAMGSGQDAISINESTFTGATNLMMGADFSTDDADTVNIEQTSAALAQTVFTGLLTVNTGAGDDTVRIGAGLPSTGTTAHFYTGLTAAGGPGAADFIDYLANTNVFELGTTVSIGGFETIQ